MKIKKKNFYRGGKMRKNHTKNVVKTRFLFCLKLMLIFTFVLLSAYYSGVFGWMKTLRKDYTPASSIIIKNDEKSETLPSQNVENNISKELERRKLEVEKSLTYREDGKEEIFYNVGYGGDNIADNPEQSLGVLEVPKVGIKTEVFEGVGSTDNSPNGDYNRLFNAVTVRAYQALGASNFVIASHTYNINGSTEHSKDWFTPLLTDEKGVVTNQISDLKLKVNDEILFFENSTGWKYTFKISKIELGEKGDSAEILYEKVNYDNLSAHLGEGIITLQGCSSGNDLLFVRGKLEKIETQSGEIYQP